MQNNLSRALLIILSSLLLLACSKKLQVNNAAEAEKLIDENQVVVAMERTPCYGKCPTYKLEIYENGLVTYDGIRFVDNIGKHYGSVSVKSIEDIINKGNEIGYFEMADVYPVNETPPQDIPQTITMLRVEGMVKQVVNKNYNSPEKLKELENLIDKVVQDVDWHLFDSNMAE